MGKKRHHGAERERDTTDGRRDMQRKQLAKRGRKKKKALRHEFGGQQELQMLRRGKY